MPFDLEDVVDLNDRAVREHRHRLGLAAEPLAQVGRGFVRPQLLDRHVAAQPVVVGQVIPRPCRRCPAGARRDKDQSALPASAAIYQRLAGPTPRRGRRPEYAERSRSHILPEHCRLTPLIGASAFSRQWPLIGGDVLAAVAEVGAAGWYVLGSRLAAFEKILPRPAARRAAAGVGNGLDALEIGLRALGLQPGEKVLTSPLSAFATTLAILRAGGVPVFVDCDEAGLLDLAAARQCLAADPEIRFCIPVHLYGFCLDLPELARLRDDFGLRMVEDGAQALGAGWAGAEKLSQVGDVGQVLATSFYPTKNLGALGDGGAVLTDDPALEENIRRLRDYGQSGKYVHSELGLNSRLDELHAAILDQVMLPRWRAWNARRGRSPNATWPVSTHPHVAPLPVPAAVAAGLAPFPVRVREAPRHSAARPSAGAGCWATCTTRWRCPTSLAWAAARSKPGATLPRARALAAEEVSLPITPDLTDFGSRPGGRGGQLMAPVP